MKARHLDGGVPIEYEQCGDKNVYSKHQAERMKSIVGKTRGKDMRVYQCDKCNGYHLTKKHRGTYD